MAEDILPFLVASQRESEQLVRTVAHQSRFPYVTLRTSPMQARRGDNGIRTEKLGKPLQRSRLLPALGQTEQVDGCEEPSHGVVP